MLINDDIDPYYDYGLKANYLRHSQDSPFLFTTNSIYIVHFINR